MADWPGLAPQNLFDGRDLMPTQSLEALMAGAMADHYGLDAENVMRELFPGRTARPVEGLLA